MSPSVADVGAGHDPRWRVELATANVAHLAGTSAAIVGGILTARAFGPAGRSSFDLVHYGAMVAPWLLTTGLGWGAVHLLRDASVTSDEAVSLLRRSIATMATIVTVLATALVAATEVAPAVAAGVAAAIAGAAVVELSGAASRAFGRHRRADASYVCRHAVALAALGAAAALDLGVSAVAWAWALGAVAALPLTVGSISAMNHRAPTATLRAMARHHGLAFPVPQLFTPALHLVAVAAVLIAHGPSIAAPFGIALGAAELLLVAPRATRLVAYTSRNAPSDHPAAARIAVPLLSLGAVGTLAASAVLPRVFGPEYAEATPLLAVLVPGMVIQAVALVEATWRQRHSTAPASVYMGVLLLSLPVVVAGATLGPFGAALTLVASHTAALAALWRAPQQ